MQELTRQPGFGRWMIACVLGAWMGVTAPAASAAGVDGGVTTETPSQVRVLLVGGLAADGLSGFEPVVADRVPHYLASVAVLPDGPALLGEMTRSVLYDGSVDSELKMAIGLAIALPDRSPYTAAHMTRLLAATESGRMLLDAVRTGDFVEAQIAPSDRRAIEWALALTESVKGLDDESFGELRRHHTEPQIIELTLTACFFNYFNRLVAAMNIPIEPWALEPARERYRGGAYAAPVARVGLLTDREVLMIADRLGAREGSSSLGLRIANSIRAMARVPDIREAWSNLGSVLRDSSIDPVLQHLVSNEVSYRNNCYYCKTHQVQKLKRSGMSVEQIARIVDSEAELDQAERLAVLFARKVTDDPRSITDEEFEAVRREFGDRGALEILHVAARFNFMNRFTDGLGLPPEDEPRLTYEQVEAARTP